MTLEGKKNDKKKGKYRRAFFCVVYLRAKGFFGKEKILYLILLPIWLTPGQKTLPASIVLILPECNYLS